MTRGKSTKEACPWCGAVGVTRRHEIEQFKYGVGDTAVTLSAAVIVAVCPSKLCAMEWTDHHGEVARERAVEDFKRGATICRKKR